MKKRPNWVQIACLVLFMNILYFQIIWLSPILLNGVMKSDLPFFAKPWIASIIGMFGGAGLGWMRTLIIILVLWNVLTLFGIWGFKYWARRSLLFILVSMIAWGTVFPLSAERAVFAMQPYINKSYHDQVRDFYWAPTLCQVAIAREDQKGIEAYCQGRVGPYEKELDLKDFNQTANQNLTIRQIAYFNYFDMSQHMFSATSWMNKIIIYFIQIFFSLWFVMMPPWLLYFLMDPQSRPLFGGLLRDQAPKKRMPILLFVLLIIMCSFLARLAIAKLS